jgi:hypothetical protein
MRGKDYKAGLRGVLFEARHHQRMGAAIWLYGWLVLRQTHQSGSIGWVLGGSPISYHEIEEETGFNSRTLERWMHTLRQHGYVETDAAPGGVIVRIIKAKKFPQAGRKDADGVRRYAGGATQVRVANAAQQPSYPRIAHGISSSSVAGSLERLETVETHRDFHSATANRNPELQHQSPSCSGSNQAQKLTPDAQTDFQLPRQPQQQENFQTARLRQQLLRAERDEAVRRELAVGTGPEVRRQ